MSKNETAVPGHERQPAQRKSGRATFSADGRSSWEWQTSTGVFTTDITDAQLAALEAPHLQLVDPSEAVTVRKSQTRRPQLASASAGSRLASAGTRPAPDLRANSDGDGSKLRRLLRRVAQLIS